MKCDGEDDVAALGGLRKTSKRKIVHQAKASQGFGTRRDPFHVQKQKVTTKWHLWLAGQVVVLLSL